MSLVIQENHFQQIVEHCQQEFPLEACGIVAGLEGRVLKVYTLTNRDQSPVSYFIEPRDLFRVVKDLRANGWEMAGIYHSHVATAPYPSQRDINMAAYPDAVYIILSLSDFNNPEHRTFTIRDGQVEEVPLLVKARGGR